MTMTPTPTPTPSAAPAEPSANLSLSYELLGVIVDVEEGRGFDEVCLRTIKRVHAALAAPDAPKGEPTLADLHELDREEGSCSLCGYRPAQPSPTMADAPEQTARAYKTQTRAEFNSGAPTATGEVKVADAIAAGEPTCKTCGGKGVVDDGEIDCYEDGTPYANGPIKCVKDCPACCRASSAGTPHGAREPMKLPPMPDLRFHSEYRRGYANCLTDVQKLNSVTEQAREPMRCESCAGQGEVFGEKVGYGVPCPNCDGSGEVKFMEFVGPDAYHVTIQCPKCLGVTPKDYQAALLVLAEFAKTAPGRLPSRVQDAVAFASEKTKGLAREPSEDAKDAARWQPMATAPKGPLVLLACADWHPDPEQTPIKVGGWWDDHWHIFGASWKPTHWMPLPPPPAGIGQSGEASKP